MLDLSKLHPGFVIHRAVSAKGRTTKTRVFKPMFKNRCDVCAKIICAHGVKKEVGGGATLKRWCLECAKPELADLGIQCS